LASQSASLWPSDMLSWGTGVIGAIRSMLRNSIFVRVRMALTILAAVIVVTVTTSAVRPIQALAQSGGVIRDIRVVGNSRIEPETVRSYLTFTAG
jgi:outer membrane protein insertion porin family